MSQFDHPPLWYWRLLSGTAHYADLYVTVGNLEPQLVRFERTGRVSMASMADTSWTSDSKGQSTTLEVWPVNHPDEPFVYQLASRIAWWNMDTIVFPAGKITMRIFADGPIRKNAHGAGPPSPLETSARQACSDCLFNTNCPPYFSAETAKEAVTLPPGLHLMCHQTTGRVCAGWRLFRHNAGLSDDHTEGLDLDSPVYKSITDFWAAYDPLQEIAQR